jgi:hypothetical protein
MCEETWERGFWPTVRGGISEIVRLYHHFAGYIRTRRCSGVSELDDIGCKRPPHPWGKFLRMPSEYNLTVAH